MTEEKFEYYVQCGATGRPGIHWGRGTSLMQAYDRAKEALGKKPQVSVGWKFPDGYEVQFDFGWVKFINPNGEADMTKVTKIDIITVKEK